MSQTVESLADFLGCENVAELGGIVAEAIKVAQVESTGLNVTFTATHVVISSTKDRRVRIGGDVRDGTITLKANKPKTRRLTDEGRGYVTIDGVRFDR